MKVLFVASECVPFVKTGGLADVAGALSRTLYDRGHDVRLVMPAYGELTDSSHRLLPLMPEMKVDFGHELLSGSILRCTYPDSTMPVYFVEQSMLFGRKGIYGNDKNDFTDNDKRFAYFNIASLWLLKGLDWKPDIIHVHDWQTGLLPVLLRHHPVIKDDPFFSGIKTVFNIHNLAYQGNFANWFIEAVGLPWEVYGQDGMEFYGRASFLKGGLVYSDQLVAVSPSYAREIQTEEHGAGMHGTLQKSADKLTGILNGIDDLEWDPAKDKRIAATFSAADLSGKARCKADAQERLGLPVAPDVPLIVMVSRMIAAKGFDLIHDSLDRLLSLGGQIAILGTGEPKFEEAFRAAAHLHPDKFAVKLEYNNNLSHQLIAGADIFLMPSKYEPCGLTQMYSMRYGTVPVVRFTGGLGDTVFNATTQAINDGTGTGFLFSEYTGDAMMEALRQAVELYRGSKAQWKKLQLNGMSEDFSWRNAAVKYEQLYEKLVSGK